MNHPVEIITLPTEDMTDVISNTYIIKSKHGVSPIITFKEASELNLYSLSRGGTSHLRERGYVHQYVYATVSQDVETIRVNDWYYDVVLNKVFQLKGICPHDICDYMTNQDKKFRTDSNNARKIIAVNDPKLTLIQGLEKGKIHHIQFKGTRFEATTMPQIQQSFLKEFVTNPDGKFEVEYFEHNHPELGVVDCTIKINQNNTVNITAVEEKTYSSEDMVEGFIKGFNIGLKSENTNDFNKALKDWIKENL